MLTALKANRLMRVCLMLAGALLLAGIFTVYLRPEFLLEVLGTLIMC